MRNEKRNVSDPFGSSGADVIKGGTGDDFILGGGNLTVGIAGFSGEGDHQHFADGQVDMLRRDEHGQWVLPTLNVFHGADGDDASLGDARTTRLFKSRRWPYGDSSSVLANQCTWRAAA